MAAVAVTVFLVLAPLAILLLSSFREGAPWAQGAFTLENYARAYGSAQTCRCSEIPS